MIVRSASVPLAILACLPLAANAADISIIQNNRANVAAVVLAGPDAARNVTITQSGVANVAGVIQAGPMTGYTSIYQNGDRNAGAIGQLIFNTGRIGRR